MAETAEQVESGLSEAQTLVFGAELLLGFQYQAIFQKAFASLSPTLKTLELTAFGLLIIVLVALIAPSSHHRIADGGEPTDRQSRFTDHMIALALAPFAIATGINVTVVTDGALGRPISIALGLAITSLALVFWFGIALMTKKPPAKANGAAPGKVSLKDKIKAVMNGGRTVLPGVQALLGFQLAAYLSDTFKKLSPLDKAVHTASLVLLTAAMIVLMAPASFHRIAEHGEDTPRVDRIGAACLLWGLAALALALAGDFFVALDLVAKNLALAATGFAVAALLALLGWFALPAWRRAGRSNRGSNLMPP